MMTKKNQVICIDDTDKNLVATTADKSDVTNECPRQLQDHATYLKLSQDASDY